MTVLEAIELLKEMQERCKMPTATDPKRFAKSDAIDIAFKVLEKQIPKEVVSEGMDESDWIYCPCCNEMLGTFDDNYEPTYCPECGQAIDWSEMKG